MGRLLADLAAPPTVLRTQSLRTPDSRLQGIGLARAGAAVECRLYLHYRDPQSHEERYEALRWTAGEEAVDSASYHFHFFPETPEGASPLDFVHPRFSTVLQALLRHERLQQLSGFWIRRHQNDWDQIDLTYPWHPPLAEVSDAMRALSAELQASGEWIDLYAQHPLRHIALTAGPMRKPSGTVYFSAPANGAWPGSLAELKEQVREVGNDLHDALEWQFFSQLPPVTAKPTQAPGEDYSADSIDSWRQVLGRGMHDHFGLFEEPWSPAMTEEDIDRAMETAVIELLPYLPRGGEVYDVGCGWGGPAGVLLRRGGYSVTGITVSRTQFRYCASLGHTVRCGDVETTLPPGRFDCALLLESLGHVRDKPRLLRVLRLFAARLVMRVHCQDSSELRASIEEAGWNIVHWRNRRPESMPSIHAWRRRLQSVAVGDDVHLETLRAFCDRVSRSAEEWAACNPLMEVVAD